MKERGILFSAPMVRALLAGSKTQTRRAWKVQPPEGTQVAFVPGQSRTPYGVPGDRLWVRETHGIVGVEGSGVHVAFAERMVDGKHLLDGDGGYDIVRPGIEAVEWAEAHIDHERWRPSIFMPRWASRITLEITDVRVERLTNISDADAIAEGVERFTGILGGNAKKCLAGGSIHIDRYARLWDSINGAGSWNTNPWVWVVEFRKLSLAEHLAAIEPAVNA
jgi:hypothetical protein